MTVRGIHPIRREPVKNVTLVVGRQARRRQLRVNA